MWGGVSPPGFGRLRIAIGVGTLVRIKPQDSDSIYLLDVQSSPVSTGESVGSGRRQPRYWKEMCYREIRK